MRAACAPTVCSMTRPSRPHRCRRAEARRRSPSRRAAVARSRRCRAHSARAVARPAPACRCLRGRSRASCRADRARDGRSRRLGRKTRAARRTSCRARRDRAIGSRPSSRPARSRRWPLASFKRRKFSTAPAEGSSRSSTPSRARIARYCCANVAYAPPAGPVVMTTTLSSVSSCFTPAANPATSSAVMAT